MTQWKWQNNTAWKCQISSEEEILGINLKTNTVIKWVLWKWSPTKTNWESVLIRDLHHAIKRKLYSMQTKKEVVLTMPNTKVFCIVDAESGFLQIELNEVSSFLTTFNTLIGRFRWLRLPFGIRCALDHFQCIMDAWRHLQSFWH